MQARGGPRGWGRGWEAGGARQLAEAGWRPLAEVRGLGATLVPGRQLRVR